MKLFIVFLLALRFYILADNILIPVPANRVDIISVCPKLTTPQYLLHTGYPLKYLHCGNTLDYSNNLRGAICRYRLY